MRAADRAGDPQLQRRPAPVRALTSLTGSVRRPESSPTISRQRAFRASGPWPKLLLQRLERPDERAARGRRRRGWAACVGGEDSRGLPRRGQRAEHGTLYSRWPWRRRLHTRSEPASWPGTTPTPATCPGAARPEAQGQRRSLPGLAVGGDAAADHRAARDALFPRPSPAAGRRWTIWPRRRTAR